jgi:hypothetical protein
LREQGQTAHGAIDEQYRFVGHGATGNECRLASAVFAGYWPIWRVNHVVLSVAGVFQSSKF